MNDFNSSLLSDQKFVGKANVSASNSSSYEVEKLVFALLSRYFEASHVLLLDIF